MWSATSIGKQQSFIFSKIEASRIMNNPERELLKRNVDFGLIRADCRGENGNVTRDLIISY